MKLVKKDFQQLWSYASNNKLTFFGQSIFFFIGLFVLVFCNQIFVNLILGEGTKIYNEIVESNVLVSLGPFIIKAILIFVAWILVMTVIYTLFQGAIWCILSSCKKTKEYLINFGKQSLRWIIILFLLLLIHLLISVLILGIIKSNPYSVTTFSILLSILQLIFIVFVIHGAVNNHAYFLYKKNPSFKSSFKFAFKLKSLRTSLYYIIYISLLQIIGSFFINYSLAIVLFVGLFLSVGTIAYYLLVLGVNKNEA